MLIICKLTIIKCFEIFCKKILQSEIKQIILRTHGAAG